MEPQRTLLKWAALAALCLCTTLAHADEGMWLFNDPPRQLLRERYQFDATDAWLEHVQKSAVRFNSGGSGSFVSADGLLMSNHHVGADGLQKLSDATHNYLRDGFYAKTHAEEKRLHDLELNVLMSIENVTDRVTAAVKEGLSPEEAFVARRSAMAAIEKESFAKTGLRSDVVTLYQGGQYHLYRYKKYTDVRLVFAPEQQIAFFGGDPDNFEYPRYNLDVCFFRAYENGQPVKVEHFLDWSRAGAAENELVFVAGHPGRTSRLLTVAELAYTRDLRLPMGLARLYRAEVLLESFSARSLENERRARQDLFGVQNSRKANNGRLQGLLDPAVMARKKADEDKLRSQVAEKPEWRDVVPAWDRIAQAQQVIATNLVRYTLWEAGGAFQSKQFGIARTLLRAAEERKKPNGERLREFVDSALESLEFQLFSEEPIYDDLETLKLADSLVYMVNQLGATNELVRQVLAGQSPQERAASLIQNTKVKDVALRKKVYQEGLAGVRDPMIELARLIDPEARAVRRVIETQDEIRQQSHAAIGRVRYAIEGASRYPDATFTLRLAFGTVKGYEENGRPIPFQTTFAGLYQRAAEQLNRPPFDLPPRWVERRKNLDLKTPFNFVSTADIIGGNSGSPVINRQGQVVGLIFDGNLQSLVLDYVYSDKQARAVSVHSQGILEALRKVYKADALAAELAPRKQL